MNAGMKMLMVENVRNRSRSEMRGPRNEMNERYGMDNRNEMSGGMDNMESRRRRDRMGRFRSDGSYAEMRSGGDVSSRRYDNGRFAPKNDFESDEPEDDYDGGESRVNRIGFNAREFEQNYSMNAGYHQKKDGEYQGGEMEKGHAKGSVNFHPEMAKEWTRNMMNEDNSRGAHWKIEQVKQVMQQKDLKFDPWEFFAIINALYSDFCKVFKKHGMNENIEFYADLAEAWLDDKDAVKNKAAMYYECIVKH